MQNNLLERYLIISKKIEILEKKKENLKGKILSLKSGYTEDGLCFDFQNRKGSIDYKMICDKYLSDKNINFDDFRRKDSNVFSIKEIK